MFILNPGDGHDVTTFEKSRDAFVALEEAFAASHNFAKLYRYEEGEFSNYFQGGWYRVSRGNLQVKVIEAASPRPT